MPRVQFDILVSKNDGLVMTAGELLEKYFFGAMPKKSDGTTMTVDTIESFIRDAQSSVEDDLSIVLQQQYVNENACFESRAFANWVFTKTTYPVDYPVRFDGYISKLRQVKYPSDWITRKYDASTRGNKARHRRVNIVPGGTNTGPISGNVIYAGIVPHMGLMNLGNIADYWRIGYVTGFSDIPDNIAAVISKKAAVPVLAMLGDIVLGAGVSGKSISIDGLSQSVSSHKTDKYGAYGPRIQHFEKEIESEMKTLKGIYRDMTLAVC